MAAYIALFISLVSLILMIIIIIRFKKLFSTDAIIDKTKSQMNRVIMDVNNNANRDIELINETSRRLRALLNESDIKMEHFREAMQLLRDTIAEAEKNGSSSHRTKKTDYVDPDASFRLTDKAPSKQGSLFDDPPQKESKSILKDETVLTPDGAAYKEVPLIVTKVYDEEPAAKKHDLERPASEKPDYKPQFKIPKSDPSLKDKVEKLFHQGMQIDDIAMELSCPSSEVQFIIDML